MRNTRCWRVQILPWTCPSWILCPALRSWLRSLPAAVWWCCPEVPKSSPRNWTNRNAKSTGEKIDVRAKTDTNSHPSTQTWSFPQFEKIKSFVAHDTTKTKSGSSLGTTGRYRPDDCIILIWCSRWESSCRYYFRLTSWGKNLREVWFITEVNKSPKCCAKCFNSGSVNLIDSKIMQINSTCKGGFMQIDIDISLKDKFHLHSTWDATSCSRASCGWTHPVTWQTRTVLKS